MKTQRLALTLAASTAFALTSTSASAAIVADLHDAFDAAIAGAPTAGDSFTNSQNWTLQGSDGTALIFTEDLGNNDPDGWAHPTANIAGFPLPSVAGGDQFDGGTLPEGLLSLHSQGASNTLQIIWTADQNYTDVFVDYFYDRRGNNGAVNSGSSSLAIGGTAGVSLAATSTEGDGTTNTVGSVSTGETIVITITGAGGGEAYGNFQVNAVPEPGSLALMGLGGLCVLRRRRA